MLRSQQQQQQRRWQHFDAIERRRLKQHPRRRLTEHGTRLDAVQRRMRLALDRQLSKTHQNLQNYRLRLQSVHPSRAVREARSKHESLTRRLRQAMLQSFNHASQKLAETARALNAVSPLSVLGRGYALIQDETGRALTRQQDFSVGQSVQVSMSDFSIGAKVTEVRLSEKESN